MELAFAPDLPGLAAGLAAAIALPAAVGLAVNLGAYRAPVLWALRHEA